MQEPASGALYKLDVDGNFVWKTLLPYYSPLGGGGTDMQASLSVEDGLVYAASNVRAYNGINADTGNTEWTYEDETANEFIVCSPIYHDGQIFLIDKFSIVCLNAKTGETIWSTYLGEELYVSPSYAGGKLYGVTDQRSVYILNATTGEKLGIFKTSSNSWSAPSLYQGRLYVGDNDWCIYCMGDSSRA